MLHYLLIAVLVAMGAYGDTNYRLNTPLYPSSYAISITPYFDTGDDTAFTFEGEVTINFRTNNITNQIKLHSQDLTFTASNITLSSGSKALTLNDALPLEFDTKYTFAYINVEKDLQVDTDYSLKIVYRGLIRSDLSGFYRNYYIENGVKKWLGATQMEPTHARKVFPCFDEPELKAVFTLTIDRPADYRPSLSNTKLQSTSNLSNGMVRDIFFPTPRMSTYLVAFLVSQFEAARYNVEGTKEFGVFTRPDAVNQSEYAFDFGKRVVTALGDYFGIDYYSTNENIKLDHIALPDFKAGAMENWGLIKYRESLLLYVPEDSTPYFKYRVAQIVAHETTHMWFGDLVTCHWWSDTWLNEGFANYFQDYITSLIEPEVGSADQLVISSVYTAYDYGEASESAPISNDDVNSPAEISTHFGAVSYQKAGSVIRMMHHLLGDEAFMFGLNFYLNSNKFGPGYPEKLYSALDEGVQHTNALSEYPGATLTDVMRSWISQAGHPILHVDVNYENDTVTLTQKRFFLDSTQTSNETYKIPITYTTAIAPDFNNTKPDFIMTEAMHQFVVSNISDDHSWIIFNVQETGLYRVNYDEHSWEIITSALKSDQRENIHYINRAKIVNDLFGLFYADEVSFSRLYDTLEFLENETNYAVWYAAVRGFNKLRNSFLGTDVAREVETFALKHLNSIINKLGYQVNATEGTVALRNRMQVLELACKLGHDGCLATAGELFKQFKDNGVEVSPSLRPMVYCYGLRQDDGEGYEFLWRRMTSTNVANEIWVIADALGCTNVDEKKKKYLTSMLEENSPIRTQDLTTPLTSILAHYENVHFILHELKDNYVAWLQIYGTMDTVLSNIASALRTQADFSEFEEWLSSCSQCTEQAVTSAKDALKTSRASSSWAEDHRASVLTGLRSSGLVTLPSLKVTLTLGFAATVLGLLV